LRSKYCSPVEYYCLIIFTSAIFDRCVCVIDTGGKVMSGSRILTTRHVTVMSLVMTPRRDKCKCHTLVSEGCYGSDPKVHLIFSGCWLWPYFWKIIPSTKSRFNYWLVAQRNITYTYKHKMWNFQWQGYSTKQLLVWYNFIGRGTILQGVVQMPRLFRPRYSHTSTFLFRMGSQSGVASALIYLTWLLAPSLVIGAGEKEHKKLTALRVKVCV
jgi:hypothetical protein